MAFPDQGSAARSRLEPRTRATVCRASGRARNLIVRALWAEIGSPTVPKPARTADHDPATPRVGTRVGVGPHVWSWSAGAKNLNATAVAATAAKYARPWTKVQTTGPTFVPLPGVKPRSVTHPDRPPPTVRGEVLAPACCAAPRDDPPLDRPSHPRWRARRGRPQRHVRNGVGIRQRPPPVAQTLQRVVHRFAAVPEHVVQAPSIRHLQPHRVVRTTRCSSARCRPCRRRCSCLPERRIPIPPRLAAGSLSAL